MLIYRF